MRIHLLRPRATNERFGLGPFFRIEPLGAEYVAAALKSAGHEAAVHDLRFSASPERLLRRHRPSVVGIAGAHTLDAPAVTALSRRIKAADPGVFTLVGGHAAAVYPGPFLDASVDAVCLEDGERVVPLLAGAIESGRPLEQVPGFLLRLDRGDPACARFAPTAPSGERIGLDEVPLPARDALATGHRSYMCVQRRPVHLVETARGCPYRCSFCSVWQHVDRTFRYRGPEWVCRDLETVGRNVFIADDLFWHPQDRSRDLALALRRRGLRKEWLLVQSRTDLVARRPDLLEAWRPISRHFDVFFGFEGPSDADLARLAKDSGVEEIREAVAVCRRLGYGTTGNFIVDPDWGVEDFERLWEFTASLGLPHLGFTILTPLPGTAYYDEVRGRIRETDWSRFDMHHVLWEPRLGRRRFFELFAETWRRSALHVRDARGVASYLRQVRPSQIPFMLRVLTRSRRLFDARAYLAETFPREAAGGLESRPEPAACAGAPTAR